MQSAQNASISEFAPFPTPKQYALAPSAQPMVGFAGLYEMLAHNFIPLLRVPVINMQSETLEEGWGGVCMIVTTLKSGLEVVCRVVNPH